MGLMRLEHPVRVEDLGDGGEVEDDGEQEHETCDGQVHSLHVSQGCLIFLSLFEEGI